MRDIFAPREALRPFEYPEAIEIMDLISKTYWVHNEVNFSSDNKDISMLKPHEREGVIRNLLAISTIEVAVKTFWTKLGEMFPKVELEMLGVAAGESEARHFMSYSRILDECGLNERFAKVKEIPCIQGRFDYLNKYLRVSHSTSDKKKLVVKLILFSCLIEHTSLFGQFIPLTYMYKHQGGIMKNIRNIINWTAKDECYIDGTEILTPKGWVKISDVKVGDRVLQYDYNCRVKEASVTKTISKYFEGDMLNITDDIFSCSVTPNHDMVVMNNGEYSKIKAKDLGLLKGGKAKFPVYLGSLGLNYESVDEFTVTPFSYSGIVSCVTVPSGAIITRLNGKHFIAGNCLHFNIGALLVNILRQEQPELFDEEMNKVVRAACVKSMKYESDILDWIWENGELEGLSKADILAFMKNQVNESMEQMGFEKCFEDVGDLSATAFFKTEMFGDSYDDFFAVRPVDYTMASEYTEDSLF